MTARRWLVSFNYEGGFGSIDVLQQNSELLSLEYLNGDFIQALGKKFKINPQRIVIMGISEIKA